MFTIKVYSGGKLKVYSCLGYERDVERPGHLLLRHAPGNVSEPRELMIFPEEGDEVYIENLTGKTIDLIRPSR